MGAERYDVIVVGARVAGATTAMLLARQGLRVLAVDRVSFPSDTISSHQLHAPGVALLQRWDLVHHLVAAGTPPARRARLDVGDGLVMDGQYAPYMDTDVMYCPRRTVLDTILVDAARRSGAEVRENFRVTEVTRSDGRVTGIRGRDRGGPLVSETATLVIGADGKRSFVADAVGARRYHERPVQAFVTYSYWSGVPAPGWEIYQRPGRAVAVYPTNDQLTTIYLAVPIAEFASARTDLEGNYLRALDLCGDLGDRVRSGTRAERLRTTPDQPNAFRQSHGPGWALVGDAGVVMDSISAQGMTHALRDADYLCAAVVAGLGGSRPLAAALQEHQDRRDQAIRGMYDFTLDLASFPPLTSFRRLFYAAVAGDQRQTDRLIGVLAGTVPAEEYFSPAAMLSVVRSLGIQELVKAEANEVLPSAPAAFCRTAPGWSLSSRGNPQTASYSKFG